MSMLSLVNFILIVVIVIFLVVHVIRRKISIVDLQEFDSLNPTIKHAYKKYIAHEVFGAIIAVLNKNISAQNLDKFIRDNDKEISEAVAKVVNSISSIPALPVLDQTGLKTTLQTFDGNNVAQQITYITLPDSPQVNSSPSNISKTVPQVTQVPLTSSNNVRISSSSNISLPTNVSSTPTTVSGPHMPIVTINSQRIN